MSNKNELSERLVKAAKCVYIACDKAVADDLSNLLIAARTRIETLEKEREDLLTGTRITYRYQRGRKRRENNQ